MKAKEIFEKLLDQSLGLWNNTCDGLIAGDENKEVHKVGTCFKLTAELIDLAVKSDIDMIITHEPTFSCEDRREDAAGFDLKKWELLDQSQITVYRFHDHAHNSEPDYIHAGFLQSLDLKIKKTYPRDFLGVRRYELAEPTTTRELGKRIRDCLNVEFVRVVGVTDSPVHTICLGLGNVGMAQVNVLFDPGCDAFITGEISEVYIDEYVRDACYFGENKSVLVLGHYSSEYAGMSLLAEKMNESMLPTVFLEGKEVYQGI